MDLMTALHTRYATKKFDPTKKVSDSDFEKLKELLQFAPSSTNLQPWRFVVISSDEGKKRLLKSTETHFPFNNHKILDASHCIVFASKTCVCDLYLSWVLECEKEGGRFANEEQALETHKGRSFFADLHSTKFNDLNCWTANQVYLNLGSFLMGAAMLGIDTVAMEGFDCALVDKEFQLTEKDYRSLFIVSIGYRAEDDYNSKINKARFKQEKIFEFI